MAGIEHLSNEYPSPDEFKKLLEQFPEDVLAKRYLLTGIPHIFREHPLQYISFCETVARNLDIGSHDVSVIGSARIGFSLSPDKYGRELKGGSDVDTVVVSEKLFAEGVTHIVHAVARFGQDVEFEEDAVPQAEEEFVQLPAFEWRALKALAKNVEWGFISPNQLPDDDDFKQRIFSALNEVATQLLGMCQQL